MIMIHDGEHEGVNNYADDSDQGGRLLVNELKCECFCICVILFMCVCLKTRLFSISPISNVQCNCKGGRGFDNLRYRFVFWFRLMTRWRRPRALRRSRWRNLLLVLPDDEVEKAEGSKEK